MPTRKLRTIAVNGLHGFLWGNGIAPAFLKEYYKRKSGPLGAAVLCMGVWFSSWFGGRLFEKVVRDQKQTLKPQGLRPLDFTACAVFCSTVAKLPLGVPLFHLLAGHPGEFQTVGFTTPARSAWRLPFELLGRQRGPSVDKICFCCKALDIQMMEPFDYTLDGELFTAAEGRLTIETGPELDFVIV